MTLKDRLNALFPHAPVEDDHLNQDIPDSSEVLVSDAAESAHGSLQPADPRFSGESAADLKDRSPHTPQGEALGHVAQATTSATGRKAGIFSFMSRSNKPNVGSPGDATSALSASIKDAVGPRPKPILILGELPPRTQYIIGGTLVAALLSAGVIVGYIGTRSASFDLERVSIATRVQMLSQRLAGSAQLALHGDLSAVNLMRQAQADLVQSMDQLTIGDGATGMGPLSREKFDSLLSLDTNTRALNARIGNLISLSTSLIQIEGNSEKLDLAAGSLSESANKLHSAAYSSGTATPQHLAAVDQLRLLAERIHRHGIVLLRSPNASGDTFVNLSADVKTFDEVLDQISTGDKAFLLPPLAGAETTSTALKESLNDVAEFVRSMEKHSANIVAARQGQKLLAGLSDSILRDATRLTEQLADATSADRTVQVASVLLLFGAMLAMLLLAFINIRLARIDAWGEAVRNRKAQIDSAATEERARHNETDIIELMTDIGALEQGDLTREFTSNIKALEGITGSVRSSLNEGVIALRNAVDTVKTTAATVSGLVQASVESTRALGRSTEEQASEIEMVVTEVTNLTSSIGRVSERTLSAARIAEEGKAAAQEGGTVVARGEQAMIKIRTLMQDVAKSVKQSGETSQEISSINQSIESITDKTKIISLNAEMEAARAGTAGAPFKVLAAEIARLAENAKELQSLVGALAQRNQGETAATIKLVEEAVHAVVEGARQSSLASAELLKIGSLTTNIAALMSEIEVTTNSQSANAGAVTTKMASLSELSRQFQESVSNVVKSVDEIDQSMGSLSETVNQFRTDPDAD